MTKHLVSIIAGHANGSNLPGKFVQVEIRGLTNPGATVSEIHRALRIMRKAREKLCPNRNHLVRLFACLGHLAGHANIAGLAITATKGITGKRPGHRLTPSQDHASV